jgi:hypothetical protein
MSNVVELNCITTLDLPAERILRRATEAGLESVVILGYDSEGQEYFASSLADGGSVLWLMERLKQQLLNVEVPPRKSE